MSRSTGSRRFILMRWSGVQALAGRLTGLPGSFGSIPLSRGSSVHSGPSTFQVMQVGSSVMMLTGPVSSALDTFDWGVAPVELPPEPEPEPPDAVTGAAAG